MRKSKIGGNQKRLKTFDRNIMDKHLKNTDNGYVDIFSKDYKLTILKKNLINYY